MAKKCLYFKHLLVGERQRAHNLDFLVHEVVSKPLTLDEIVSRVKAALA
jgi:hypothetical protein